MCGIFGFSFKKDTISPGRRAIFANNLARLNDRRGGHSYGSAIIENNEVFINKGLGDFGDHAYQLADANFFLGHTRYATVGAKTIANSHPFEIGNMIGAHNGGVANHNELDKKYNRSCDVDSMHFFHHLDTNQSFGDIEGYGSIEWIDRNDLSKIYLSRLKGGMLSIFGIGKPEDAKSGGIGIAWSSDEKHLLEAFYTAGITDFFPYKVEEGVVFFAHDGEVYIDNHRKLDIAKEAHRNGNKHWEGGYGGNNNFQNKSNNTSTSTTTTPTTTLKDQDLKDWQDWNEYCEEKLANGLDSSAQG